jgi:hypothetical protein
MPAPRILGLIAVTFLAQACASIAVEYDFDPAANFAAYSTYDWMPAESRRVDLRARDPMVEKWIRDAIEVVMRAKGFQKAGPEGPDIRIAYLLVLEDGVDSQTIYQRSDPDWRYRTYGPATTTTRSQLLTTGTLVIDVFDAGRKELVWRGAAQGEVRELQDPDKREARVSEAVNGILAGFPPGR